MPPAAVTAFHESQRQVVLNFLENSGTMITRLNDEREAALAQRPRRRGLVNGVPYRSALEIVVAPKGARASGGPHEAEQPAPQATSAEMEIEAHEAGEMDENATVFPDNSALMKHYNVLQQEAGELSLMVVSTRVWIAMNLPEVREWEHPSVRDMMGVVAALEELNDKQIGTSQSALLKYMSQRRDLEQRRTSCHCTPFAR